jgi:hypothetical protein
MMMFCVSVGIGQGFQPVSAFNYGAKKYSRVREAFQCTCIINVCIMLVATVIVLTFAEPLIRLFRDDPEVIVIGTKALRLQSVTLPFMAVSLSGNMLFQSIGKGLEGTILASLRSGLCFHSNHIGLEPISGNLWHSTGAAAGGCGVDCSDNPLCAPVLCDHASGFKMNYIVLEECFGYDFKRNLSGNLKGLEHLVVLTGGDYV